MILKRQTVISKPLSDEYLSEVRKRCEEATSGPWVSFIEGRDHMSGESFIQRSLDDSVEDLYLRGATVEDQDFIAHARQDIPILLDEIERLKRQVENISNDQQDIL
jgi:hypothetical protein